MSSVISRQSALDSENTIVHIEHINGGNDMTHKFSNNGFVPLHLMMDRDGNLLADGMDNLELRMWLHMARDQRRNKP